jgi:chromosome segregation ATPase
MKRLQEENESLTRRCMESEKEMKRLQTEYAKLDKMFKSGQTAAAQLRGELQSINTEKIKLETENKTYAADFVKLKAESEKCRLELVEKTSILSDKEEELSKVKDNCGKAEAGLEEHKNTVKQVDFYLIIF